MLDPLSLDYAYESVMQFVPHWHACVAYKHPDHDLELTFAVDLVFAKNAEKAEEAVWQRIMRAGIASNIEIDLNDWRLTHRMIPSINSN